MVDLVLAVHLLAADARAPRLALAEPTPVTLAPAATPIGPVRPGPRLGETLAGAGTMLAGDALIVAGMAAIIDSQGVGWDTFDRTLLVLAGGTLALAFGSPGFAVLGVWWASDSDGSAGRAYLLGLAGEGAVLLASGLAARAAPSGGWGPAGSIAASAAFLVAVPLGASWGWHLGAPATPAAPPAAHALPESPPRADAPRTPAAVVVPLAAARF